MRIIAGRFKRRQLASPKGDGIRPTTDRTREAMFNVISSRMDLNGASVADLYCGSGSLGLEAYSRGAARVEFVDRDAKALALARTNALALDEHAPCRFVKMDVRAWASHAHGPYYDLILADPPYHSEGIPTLAEALLPRLSAGGFIILEHDRSLRLPDHPALAERRTYGKTGVAIYHHPVVDEQAP